MKKNRSTIRFIRLLSIMLIVFLFMVTVIGCVKSDEGSKTSTSDKPDTIPGTSASDNGFPKPGVLPLVTKPTTLTIGISQHALTTDYENNDFTQLVEEVTGVSLDFVLFPTDGNEAKQKFSLMVSANQELPDILCMGFSDIERYNYGSNGVLIPLNDYFEKESYYFWQTLRKWASEKEIEDVFKYGTSPDGNLYAYPTYYIDPGDASALGCWINKKWLDGSGLNVPKTTDDFYTVLKTFYDNDTNGNGNSGDEIPLIGHTEWKGSVTDYLMNSFIYANGTKLSAENGKIYAPYITDEWREGLRYIHKLVKEGLLSPLSFSQTSNELRAILSDPSDDPNIIGAFVAHPSPMFGSDGVWRAMEYIALPAMTGPEGVNWTPNDGWFASYNTQITKDCENPKLAFRVMDTISREDMSLSMREGVQDVDWEYTNEGEPSHVIEGYKVVFKSLANAERPSRWTSENNTIWHANFMNQAPPKLFGGKQQTVYSNEYRRYQMRDLWYESVPLRYNNYPEELVNKFIYTQEELDEISEIQASINSYVEEMRTRYILGDANIETEWDSYLATLDSMGLELYLKISQQCYDRMNSN